jgi:amidase
MTPKLSRRIFLQQSVAAALATTSLMGCERQRLAESSVAPEPFDELLDYDCLGLAGLIKSGEVTQSEIVETIIRRIEAVNPVLNFMTNRFYDRARDIAGAISMDTAFAGVPMLLKDMIDLAGVPRTDGSNFPAENVPQHSALYVQGLERAGFNFIGMTNVPEYAGVGGTDNDRFGATRNPWNLDYYPNHSSGGAAASVAAGVLPMAHGTDGAGSNRLPASVTGLLGMKPTRYRMLADSHDGQHDLAKTNQMISRTVRDSAMVFHLTQDHDNGRYPSEELIEHKGRDRLRIGFAPDRSGLTETSAEVLKATEEAARLLEDLGHEIIEADYPVDPEELFVHYSNFFAGKTANLKIAIEAATGQPIMESGVLTRFLAGNLVANEGVSAEDLAAAQEFINSLAPAFDSLFENFDMLLTPVAPRAGVRISEFGADTEFSQIVARQVIGTMKFTGPVNLSGCPAMSVPFSWNSTAGLPIGAHFVAARGKDRALYEIAYELEEARPWKDKWAPNSLRFH